VVTLLLDRYLSGLAKPGLLLNRVGLAGLPAARELLRSLIGVEIHTVTGRPNEVFALEGDMVRVRTGDSPDGQLVKISEMQQGLDLLARGRVSAGTRRRARLPQRLCRRRPAPPAPRHGLPQSSHRHARRADQQRHGHPRHVTVRRVQTNRRQRLSGADKCA
jgi:hypothetical protein